MSNLLVKAAYALCVMWTYVRYRPKTCASITTIQQARVAVSSAVTVMAWKAKYGTLLGELSEIGVDLSGYKDYSVITAPTPIKYVFPNQRYILPIGQPMRKDFSVINVLG